MRCRVLDCIENVNGYCLASSYIEIDENGECDSICVPTEEENTIQKSEDNL